MAEDEFDDSFLREIENYDIDVDKEFGINFNNNVKILNSLNNILNFEDGLTPSKRELPPLPKDNQYSLQGGNKQTKMNHSSKSVDVKYPNKDINTDVDFNKPNKENISKSSSSSFLPVLKDNNNKNIKKDKDMFFQRIEHNFSNSVINSARREVESDLDIESIHNSSMNSTKWRNTHQKNLIPKNEFTHKFEEIKKDWQFEDGSNLENAYMQLQKRR